MSVPCIFCNKDLNPFDLGVATLAVCWTTKRHDGTVEQIIREPQGMHAHRHCLEERLARKEEDSSGVAQPKEH